MRNLWVTGNGVPVLLDKDNPLCGGYAPLELRLFTKACLPALPDKIPERSMFSSVVNIA